MALRQRALRLGGAGLLSLALLLGVVQPSAATAGKLNLFGSVRVGGGSGQNDQRDADIYPAVAFDPSTGRYLAVWLTARHATSSSSALDVYARFLNSVGEPVGGEFRLTDSTSAARSSLPAVAAGGGRFLVTWTQRASPCRVTAQLVGPNGRQGSNQPLALGSGPAHSPSLVYNPARSAFALAFVAGDDYLPPTLMGAATTDCGSNAASTSRVRVAEVVPSGNTATAGTPVDVSSVAAGGFRPSLAYSQGALLAVWEDRRDVAGAAYRFDVYGQKITSNLAMSGANFPLTTGHDYTNQDTSATWTPRPAVAGGPDGFLAAWFGRNNAAWTALAALVPSNGAPGTPFALAQMSYPFAHPGAAPSGFLAAIYSPAAEEYLFGMSSYLDSAWGYLSFALVQRLTPSGQLLRLDGTPQPQAGVGWSIDYQLEDQIGLALAANPFARPGTADYVALYSKHPLGQPATDIDIFGVQVASHRYLFLPGVRR